MPLSLLSDVMPSGKAKGISNYLDALAYYFRHDSYNSGKAEQLLTYDSAYHSLLAEHFQPVSQELQTWESSPYNKNKNYPEQLKHKTCKNEFMRSKSEAMNCHEPVCAKNSLSL